MCFRCSVKKAVEIHHPWTIADGGPCFDPANRIPLCKQCHRLEQINPTFHYE